MRISESSGNEWPEQGVCLSAIIFFGNDAFHHRLLRARAFPHLERGDVCRMKDVLKANYACARDPRAAWIPVDSPACEVKGTLDIGANEVEIGSMPPFILKQKINTDTPPVLLDVREKHELNGPLGHLQGIVHIPIGKLSHRLSELDQYQGKELVTVCRSGGRAYTAAQILGAAGFQKVTVLEGGMIGWNAM